MKGPTEALMSFQGFAAWKWEDEFRAAISSHRPDADDAVVERMKLSIVDDFVEFVMEVVSPELGLSILVDVEGFGDKSVVGTIDFEDRKEDEDLAYVERRIAEWGPVQLVRPVAALTRERRAPWSGCPRSANDRTGVVWGAGRCRFLLCSTLRAAETTVPRTLADARAAGRGRSG